jgi:uncharacterized membrane protein
MQEHINNFIQQFYIDPITYETGYNIYNTITYAIIFIIAAFLVYKLLKFIKIRIDNNFLYGIIPYVILGGLLRALEDALIVSGFWFKTPMIYVIVFIIAFVTLSISLLVEKYTKYKYHNLWLIIGIVILLFGFAYVRFVSSFAFISVIGITIFWIFIFLAIKNIAKIKKYNSIDKFLSKENLLLLIVHMFDASTTFTALNFFSYFEQHVFPSFLINIFGPIVMFPLKLIVIILVLYVLDKELCKKQDLEKRNFIKFLILILGLAPGLRNLLRLVMLM